MAIDDQGYLVNECSWQSIQSPWTDCVEALRNLCVEEFGDRLHSLYLRGSVPRGQGILNISDLDSVAIFRQKVTPEMIATINSLESQLEKQFKFCQKIEISFAERNYVQEDIYWQAILQTQGLCIYGEDMRSQFPRFKPSLDLVSHAFQIAEDIAETQTILRQTPKQFHNFDATIKQRCLWINKRIVRTGFELVMLRENSFTRDLYPCYERFAKHFPAQSKLMYKSLELAIQPSSDRDGLLMFLSHFGSWLASEVNRTFNN